MLTSVTQEWTRLGRLVRERREALGLPQGAGNVSAATWRKVEKAIEPPYARRTVVGICMVLGWDFDSFDLITAGGDPVEVAPEEPLGTSEEEFAALKRELAELQELKAEVRELNDRLDRIEQDRQRS